MLEATAFASSMVTGGHFFNCTSYPLQIIGIILHHLFTFKEIFCPVISTADFVLILMGKLALYNIRCIAFFIQDGAGQGAEAMAGHAILVAHAAQAHQHRAITDMLGGAGGAEKNKLLIAGS